MHAIRIRPITHLLPFRTHLAVVAFVARFERIVVTWFLLRRTHLLFSKSVTVTPRALCPRHLPIEQPAFDATQFISALHFSWMGISTLFKFNLQFDKPKCPIYSKQHHHVHDQNVITESPEKLKIHMRTIPNLQKKGIKQKVTQSNADQGYRSIFFVVARPAKGQYRQGESTSPSCARSACSGEPRPWTR